MLKPRAEPVDTKHKIEEAIKRNAQLKADTITVDSARWLSVVDAQRQLGAGKASRRHRITAWKRFFQPSSRKLVEMLLPVGAVYLHDVDPFWTEPDVHAVT